MVESIGSGTIRAGEAKLGAVARTGAVTAAVQMSVAPRDTSVQPTTTARALAASAPVDMDRVRLIKHAIEQGNFPLSPATVADRLIALRYEWMSHDAS